MTVDGAASAAGSPSPRAVAAESVESIQIDALRRDLLGFRDSIAALDEERKRHSSTAMRWLKIVLVICAGLVLARILQLSFSNAVVIEPMSVPKSIADNGYTPEVVAARLETAMRNVYRAAGTAKDLQALALPTHSVLDNVEVPETKLSLATFVELFRYLFGIRPTTVEGTIVQEGKELRLMILISAKHRDTAIFTARGATMDSVLADAAHFTLRSLDPYIEACYLEDEGRSDEAIALARQTIHSRFCDPSCQSLLYNLWGNTLTDQHQTAAAIAKFREAIARDPHNRFPRYSLSDALQSQHDYRGAMEQLDAVLAEHDKDATAHEYRGSIYLDLHQPWKALSEERIAAKLDPSDAFAEKMLGVVYYRLRQFREGDEHFRNAVAMEPDEASNYVAWGDALRESGDAKGAVANYRRALQIDPKLPLELKQKIKAVEEQ